MCLQRSAPPDAVEDAPSLDPWLKATSGGRLATYGPGDGAACEVLVLCGEFLRRINRDDFNDVANTMVIAKGEDFFLFYF